MPTINHSREFRPGRLLAVIAVALVVAYAAGVLTATADSTTTAPPPSAVCAP
ncbi:hypothetical protein [Saccharothrix sp. NRRL B-16314]|uniref:hypothetical protein n=1 Tax=Saccharothrix sp. NRRL B-16314 TaxID=1463825 RepID=UPI000B258D6D|nr:hypothetical protein [Saccharothrix sp. NRRL B-16314]